MIQSKIKLSMYITPVHIICKPGYTFEIHLIVSCGMRTKINFSNAKVRNPIVMFTYIHFQISEYGQISDRHETTTYWNIFWTFFMFKGLFR